MSSIPLTWKTSTTSSINMFDSMMDLVKDLSRKDYNRLKDAMDLGYNAYQKVKNIDSDDCLSTTAPEFLLHEKEGE